MNDIIDIIEQYYYNKIIKKLIDEYKCSVEDDHELTCFIFKPGGKSIGSSGRILYRRNGNCAPIYPFNKKIYSSSAINFLPINYWWSSGKTGLSGYKNIDY